ncbi:MAG: lytic murein transglycosylase [Rickettsiales bacterium]|nr:lytic murein transglycosylase [Rickettsiales bacterium]
MIKNISKILAISIIISSCSLYKQEEVTEEGFSKWLDGFKREASKNGISSATFDDAFENITLNKKVVELDTKQPERRGDFRFANYKERAVTKQRISEGKQKLKENYNLLSQVEKKFGVQKEFIVALWGIETNFGGYTGDFYIPRSLASLAYEGRRRDFFKNELLYSLKILQDGHIDKDNFKGSWAGAMGQCQFMPTTFARHAYDFNQDGRKDIWHTKADIFASAANYLSSLGWEGNVGWGNRVSIPKNFNKNLMGRDKTKKISEWLKLGVKNIDKKSLPHPDYNASLIDVDGENGNGSEVYLVYKNFKNIMDWNRSTYFATSVGMIADELSMSAKR